MDVEISVQIILCSGTPKDKRVEFDDESLFLCIGLLIFDELIKSTYGICHHIGHGSTVIKNK